jgi:hypothetical protein
MASSANNFSLEELGDFFKTLDEEKFAFLFEQTLQVIRTTSATGIFQTATDFDFAIYKHLEGLQKTYSDKLNELGVTPDSFNTLLFFATTFKDAYTCLLYETANDFMGKKKEISRE